MSDMTTEKRLEKLDDGRPMLRLLDEKGEAGLALRVDSEGSPMLVAYDKKGRVRTALGITPGGMPLLSLYDEKGTIRAALGAFGTTPPDGKVTMYPESSLLLFGPDGKVRWQAP